LYPLLGLLLDSPLVSDLIVPIRKHVNEKVHVNRISNRSCKKHCFLFETIGSASNSLEHGVRLDLGGIGSVRIVQQVLNPEEQLNTSITKAIQKSSLISFPSLYPSLKRKRS
jgi:hypothetical protein